MKGFVSYRLAAMFWFNGTINLWAYTSHEILISLCDCISLLSYKLWRLGLNPKSYLKLNTMIVR